MSLQGKSLDSIQESDLQTLVENEVSERKYLEYKQALPGNSDSDKKEFLADVTSFANAAGGDLIYGVKDEDGVAVEVCGLAGVNRDEVKLRLENRIRDGVEPRIPGLSIEPIVLEKKGFAIIIRVPKSWASPHRVTLKGHDKFYSRNSAGKYPMDVSELRAAFLLSETTAERIRNFRDGRLARIVAGETPVPLYDAPKIVIHIVPFGSFAMMERIDLSGVQDEEWPYPIGSSSCGHHYNFDGVVTYDTGSESAPVSYLQLFRNGIIEAVDACLLGQEDRPKKIHWKDEVHVRDACERYLQFQKDLGVPPPVIIMYSLMGVMDFGMVPPPALSNIVKIDRDQLIVPEVMMETYDEDLDGILKPMFDAVWNAAGWDRSRNYDPDGKWSPHS